MRLNTIEPALECPNAFKRGGMTFCASSTLFESFSKRNSSKVFPGGSFGPVGGFVVGRCAGGFSGSLTESRPIMTDRIRTSETMKSLKAGQKLNSNESSSIAHLGSRFQPYLVL